MERVVEANIGATEEGLLLTSYIIYLMQSTIYYEYGEFLLKTL